MTIISDNCYVMPVLQTFTNGASRSLNDASVTAIDESRVAPNCYITFTVVNMLTVQATSVDVKTLSSHPCPWTSLIFASETRSYPQSGIL